VTTPEWRPLADALASMLDADGGLGDPLWRRAFAETPRHVFVPRYVEQNGNGECVVDGADPAQRDRWLDRVYSDTNLITQVGPSKEDGRGRRPTSSSSMPSIMAWMLDALHVAEGHRVLEIGTGTGYNAALLCHRLGDTNVASIDIDPVLVSEASDRLAELGYAPALLAGDGADGVPDAAPFDAILATASVDHIPPAWIDQLRPGGMLVTDLRGSFSGAMVHLHKIDDDTVQGHCASYDAAFMPLRQQLDYSLRQGASTPLVLDRRNPQRGTTTTDPRLIAQARGLRFVIELQLAGTHADLFVGTDEVVVSGPDGSWASAALTPSTDGTHAIHQAGPRRLWDSVDAAVTTWRSTGTPEVDAFGVTAGIDANDQRVWLGDPQSAHTWPLPI
jgi:protein-L-isoaspartate(D-aspartate) O-methyltransferase